MIYIISAIVFYRLGLGDASLVYANIVNLSARIAYCLRFTANFFNRPGSSSTFRWKSALPSISLCVVTAFSSYIIVLSERWLKANVLAMNLGRAALLNPHILLHVAIGGLLATTCLFTWWTTSGRNLNLPLRRSKLE